MKPNNFERIDENTPVVKVVDMKAKSRLKKGMIRALLVFWGDPLLFSGLILTLATGFFKGCDTRGPRIEASCKSLCMIMV